MVEAARRSLGSLLNVKFQQNGKDAVKNLPQSPNKPGFLLIKKKMLVAA